MSAVRRVGRKWDERERGGGKFRAGPRCDACGKPTGADYMTDERVCGNSDGPGFFLCGRKRCTSARDAAEANGGLAALALLYTTQRKINDQTP